VVVTELLLLLQNNNDQSYAIKRRAIDTDATAQLLLTVLNQTAQQIISTAITNCSEAAAAAQLPPLRHIRRGIQRVKKDAGNPIPVPQNLQTNH
jgi:hypothetical protein